MSVARSKDGDPVRGLSNLAARGFQNPHEAAQAMFGLIYDLVGLRVCVLTRVDLATNTLTVLEASDRAGLGLTKGMTAPADEMPCHFVVTSATALRERDLDLHPLFRGLPLRAKLRLRSYIGVPLRRENGSIWGTLAAADTDPLETTEAHLQTLTVLARLVAFEFEREEQREQLAAHARMLTERLAMAEQLEEERLRAVRLQTILEAAAMVSHEINNPLTVLQLRMQRLLHRCGPTEAESRDDLEVALEAASEINQVTVRLRNVVRPVSTNYLAPARMIDLAASTRSSDEATDGAGSRKPI